MSQRIKALTDEQLVNRYESTLKAIEELVLDRVRGDIDDFLLHEIIKDLTDYKRELLEREELELLADMTEALL